MRRLGIPVSIVILIAAAVLALTGRWPWRRLVVARPIIVSTAFQEISDTLRNGETLVDVFSRQGLSGVSLVEMFQGVGLDPRRLRAGLVVQFRREAGELLPNGITIRTSQIERLRARRQAEAWQAERQPVAWTSGVIRIEGPIESSLYEALDATIPDPVFDEGNRIRLAWDLADVYAWSIDFNRDIQTGDRFAVVLSRETSELGEVRFGDILAADLLVSGSIRMLFASSRCNTWYGSTTRWAILSAAHSSVRRSSSAGSLRRSRARVSIRSWASGAGTKAPTTRREAALRCLPRATEPCSRAGRSGGYGNLVELRHANGITTRYGHLRAFARGVRTGKRVSQGDVIGYVGSTGLASAPHLHYEFRVHGAARDSRRVDLGEGEPLERIHLPRFTQERTQAPAPSGHRGAGCRDPPRGVVAPALLLFLHVVSDRRPPGRCGGGALLSPAGGLERPDLDTRRVPGGRVGRRRPPARKRVVSVRPPVRPPDRSARRLPQHAVCRREVGASAGTGAGDRRGPQGSGRFPTTPRLPAAAPAWRRP